MSVDERIPHGAVAPRRRGDWKRGAVIGALLITVLLVGFHALRFPWSISFTGGPTLTGEWFGVLPSATGDPQWIALELSSNDSRCNSNCRNIDVKARLCSSTHTHAYRGSGDTQNWRGTRFWLELAPTEYESGRPRSIRLRGNWEGQQIAAEVAYGDEFAPGPRTSTISEADVQSASAPAVVSLTLSRAANESFPRACKGI